MSIERDAYNKAILLIQQNRGDIHLRYEALCCKYRFRLVMCDDLGTFVDASQFDEQSSQSDLLTVDLARDTVRIEGESHSIEQLAQILGMMAVSHQSNEEGRGSVRPYVEMTIDDADEFLGKALAARARLQAQGSKTKLRER